MGARRKKLEGDNFSCGPFSDKPNGSETGGLGENTPAARSKGGGGLGGGIFQYFFLKIMPFRHIYT